MDRRLVKLAPSVATATLALMTAAWAATGDVPLAAGGGSAEPLAIAAAATGPLPPKAQSTNSRGSRPR
jgi:hypothetical protein